LNFNSASHSVNGTGELSKNAIAGRFDNAAAMLRNFWVKTLFPVTL
jgi:hypothetical protein